MTKALLKNWKWLGYLVYAVLLTTGLLYYRFPSDRIRAYLVSELGRADPPMNLSLKTVRPGFPPGVDLIDVAVAVRETPQKHLLQAKDISIVPAVWTFLSGSTQYCFDIHAYHGNIEGRVRFKRNGVKAPLKTSLQFKGIDIGLHPYLPPLVGREVSGVLEGTVQYAGYQNNLIEGTGQGAIVISDGKVKLLQPILGLDSIDFDRFSVKMALKDRKIAVTHAQLEGRTIKGDLSGTITLKTDLSRSMLDLKGTMEPLGGLLGNIKGNAAALTFLRQGLKKLNRSFVIQGTFRNPVFRFS
jgi:type II secretion system protein N